MHARATEIRDDDAHTAPCSAAFRAGLYNAQQALQHSRGCSRLTSHTPVEFRSGHSHRARRTACYR